MPSQKFIGENRTAEMLSGIKSYSDVAASKNRPDVSEVSIVTDPATNKIHLTWRDPSNADWAGTMIRRKKNAPPMDETDGELVGNFIVRDQHISTPYEDPNAGSTSGNPETFYYRFFPYTSSGYSTHGSVYSHLVDTIIVTWADGTNQQVEGMLLAHHAGTMNVRDYWNVGDVRTDPATGVQMRLVDDTDSYVLTKNDKTSTRTHGAFVVLLDNVRENMTFGGRSTANKAYNPTGYHVNDMMLYTCAQTTLCQSSTSNPQTYANENLPPVSLSDLFRNVNVKDVYQSQSTPTPGVTSAVLNKYTDYVNKWTLTTDVVCIVNTHSIQTNRKFCPLSLKNLGIVVATDSFDALEPTFKYFNTAANLNRYLTTELGTRSIITTTEKRLPAGSANTRDTSLEGGSIDYAFTFFVTGDAGQLYYVNTDGTTGLADPTVAKDYMFYGVI